MQRLDFEISFGFKFCVSIEVKYKIYAVSLNIKNTVLNNFSFLVKHKSQSRPEIVKIAVLFHTGMTNSIMTHEHYINELCNLSSFVRRLPKYMFQIQLRVQVYSYIHILLFK